MGLQWPSKRVEALGERKFRDIVGILPQLGHLRDTSGTRPQNPGLCRPFRDYNLELPTVPEWPVSAGVRRRVMPRAKECRVTPRSPPLVHDGITYDRTRFTQRCATDRGGGRRLASIIASRSHAQLAA